MGMLSVVGDMCTLAMWISGGMACVVFILLGVILLVGGEGAVSGGFGFGGRAGLPRGCHSSSSVRLCARFRRSS
jgi:hypothetical protein